jgi:NADPH-dependent 7-cyano-7-deazaguanine reductase QueF
LYLALFHNHRGSHEDCTRAFTKKIGAAAQPQRPRIGGYWHPPIGEAASDPAERGVAENAARPRRLSQTGSDGTERWRLVSASP